VTDNRTGKQEGLPEGYSIPEIGQMFGLSTQRVRRIIKEGKLGTLELVPTKAGPAYRIPVELMVGAGYELKNPTGNASGAEVEALKASLEASTKREIELNERLFHLDHAKQDQWKDLQIANEQRDSAQANLDGLRRTLDSLQASLEAKTREVFLLEQSLLRIPLAVGTGTSWWQKLKSKAKETNTPSDTSTATPL
jgi:hypothetical protein